MDKAKNQLKEVVILLDGIIKELDFDRDYEKRIKLVGINAEIKSLIRRWNELKSSKELYELNKAEKRWKQFERSWRG